jgi:hypothetical protein
MPSETNWLGTWTARPAQAEGAGGQQMVLRAHTHPGDQDFRRHADAVRDRDIPARGLDAGLRGYAPGNQHVVHSTR